MVGNAEPVKEYNYRPLSKLCECQLDVNDQVSTKGLAGGRGGGRLRPGRETGRKEHTALQASDVFGCVLMWEFWPAGLEPASAKRPPFSCYCKMQVASNGRTVQRIQIQIPFIVIVPCTCTSCHEIQRSNIKATLRLQS